MAHGNVDLRRKLLSRKVTDGGLEWVVPGKGDVNHVVAVTVDRPTNGSEKIAEDDGIATGDCYIVNGQAAKSCSRPGQGRQVPGHA